jgi:hypothetical protein
VLKHQKDYRFSNTMVHKTIKFVAHKHFDTLKPKYFIKSWYFSKTLKKYLVSNTGPKSWLCTVFIHAFQLRTVAFASLNHSSAVFRLLITHHTISGNVMGVSFVVEGWSAVGYLHAACCGVVYQKRVCKATSWCCVSGGSNEQPLLCLPCTHAHLSCSPEFVPADSDSVV